MLCRAFVLLLVIVLWYWIIFDGYSVMTKKESEILADIVNDIENSDDKIWPLERLFLEVKRMIKN